ncbi:phosphotransferase enzyme family protein [Lunatibacter salilacus]|uniref:phosphotransferase enzyme family protein n=1 Tax=Lunatibacter salilacus TaxID=2483804 RepID=UPI00131EA2C2|nr:aminoglycoside phosphotransferase family protein [Lunatibacter salilacus]
MENSIVEAVLKQYPFETTSLECAPFGSGHIHSTFRVKVGGNLYILQEFNDQVFKFPERISGNLQVLLNELQPGALPYELPLPVKNKLGEFFTSISGRLFRLFPFVSGVTKDSVDNPHQSNLAAEAFANFVKVFLPVDASLLRDTIPSFHDLDLRFRQFEESVQTTDREIDSETAQLIDFYQKQHDLVETYNAYTQLLPKRVTHNDTKINNLIYSEDLTRVNAVIDLDTIMAGYVFYDFGDLVRTVVCTEDEASHNWAQIRVDLDKYESLIEGFYLPLIESIESEELASLTFGGEMMTCIMGLRFLADYLNGNKYYHITYENQNLHRAKNQSKLLQSLRDNRPQIQKLVDRVGVRN